MSGEVGGGGDVVGMAGGGDVVADGDVADVDASGALWKRITDRQILLWLSTMEQGQSLVVSCRDATPLKVPSSWMYFICDTCWTDLSPAFPALCAAFGVEKIYRQSCPKCAGLVGEQGSGDQGSGGQATQLAAMWRHLYGDYVCDEVPKVHPLRKAVAIDMADVGMPRRFALGIGAISDLPVDVDADEPARFQQAIAALSTSPFPALAKKPTFGYPKNTHPTGAGAIRAAGANVAPASASVPAPATPASAPAPATPASAHAPDPQYSTPAPTSASAPAPPAAPAPTFPTWANDLYVDDCVACDVCVKACPTHALTITHDGDTSTLSFNPARCRRCENCIRLCPDQVLHTRGALQATTAEPTALPPRILATVRTHPCAQCGFIIPISQGELCAHCLYRRDNPFGFKLPPGMTLDNLPPL